MAGPLLGGGHGYLQGFYGLVSDNLISARVVLANGEAITVSATQNSGMSKVLDLESEVPFSIGSRRVRHFIFADVVLTSLRRSLLGPSRGRSQFWNRH